VTPDEWDRFRRRWVAARQQIGLGSPEDPDFGQGGFVRHAPEVRTRFVILSADPSCALLEFDEDFWTWWLGEWPNPFDGARPTAWGTEHTPTSGAAVRFDWSGDSRWTWNHYLALHRTGALEFGLGRLGSRTFQHQGQEQATRVFFLTTTVGRMWWALSRYGDVINRAGIDGPWELTLSFRGTQGSALGNVGAGWAEPDQVWLDEFPACPDSNVMITRELEFWPDASALQAVVLSIGGNIEDAWGCRNRRFLAREDPNAGDFDVSRYR
jgi:hypothetical protein